jgi:CheY-like chemotaxis protein
LLKEFGYHTRDVCTGPDALRIVPSFKPDVVLVDLALIGACQDFLEEQLSLCQASPTGHHHRRSHAS